MPKNALVVAGPKLQKALKDLAGGVKNIDLSTEKAPPKPQQILTRTVKPAAYNGMFAVTDNGGGTATVKGGSVMVRFNDVPIWIDEKILPFTSGASAVALIAKREDVRAPWQIELVSCTNGKLPELYIPGTQMYIEIAGYSVVDDRYMLCQFWQGGMIRFCDRYYVE